jgi:hypothetical protein
LAASPLALVVRSRVVSISPTNAAVARMLTIQSATGPTILNTRMCAS